MNEIVNTTFDKELSSFLELNYISKDMRKAFWELIVTFVKIPKPSDSDIHCIMDAFGLLEAHVLYNIKDKAIQTDAKYKIGLLKSTLLIETYRSRDGFTRTIETTTLN